MPKSDSSNSIGKENDSDSNSEEVAENPRNGGRNMREVPEYEKQRMKRMEENRARMEALGLHKMASSLMGSVPKKNKKREARGKRKVNEEDEEYMPNEEEEEEEELSYSSGGEEEENDDGDDFVGGESSQSQINKPTKKNSAPKKKVPVQKVVSDKDFVDDEDALMQAIALSLQDSSGFLNVGNKVPSQNSYTKMIDGNVNERKGNAGIEEDTGKRKRKKPISSRVQMTEDEVIGHFFQFDEAGKGDINLRDLRRIAAAHDFTWSDMEMANMICFFDSDGDGKLSLHDFRKIVGRCNMLQEPENAVMGSKT